MIFLDFVRNVETRQVAIYCVYQPDTQEINVIDLKNSALQKCSATVTKTIKRHPFCLELFSPHMATNAWRTASDLILRQIKRKIPAQQVFKKLLQRVVIMIFSKL